MMRFNKLRQKLQTRVEFKLILGFTVVSMTLVALLIILFQSVPKDKASAAPAMETMPAGSFIINMGITPQTNSNALKPYGLLYQLIENHSVPAKWIINPSKTRDGEDFNYNSVSYKAGPFIIEAEHIDSTITALIATWQAMGVQGVYTTSAVSVPVYMTINHYPNILIDNLAGNDSIVVDYYANAGIDSTAYDIGTPADLQACHDLWANPHGDPVWETHGYLHNFVAVQKSYIWSQCHAVSMLEGTQQTVSPFQQLNYLTLDGLKCWKTAGLGPVSCGPSITESHGKTETPPFSYFYPAEPVMQFLGNAHNAHDNGSEQWFRPQSTGGWRPTTKLLITTATGTSPTEGVLMVYGRGYGDASNGEVMYMAGHDMTGSGTTLEQIAAQRSFHNFNLLAGKAKELLISSYSIPGSYYAGQTRAVSVTVTSGYPPYTYQWTSTLGGTFANPNAASTTYTAPVTLSELNGIIKCVITDACGRKNIMVVPLNVFITGLPVELTSFTASQNLAGQVDLAWTTQSEINNDYFTILRSADGSRFTTIARIPGTGNSTSPQDYTCTDPRPFEGANYYRLQQTNFNGQTETFTTLLVTVSRQQNHAVKLLVAPNPFSKSLSVRFDSESDTMVVIKLLTLQSKSVFNTSARAVAGSNVAEVNLPDNIPPGNYILQVWSRGSLIGSTQVVCSQP